MKITHKIDIHLDNYRPTPEIVVMQCDANTRELQFTLYSNNAAWPIPEATKIYVGYSKPDGTGGFYDTLPDGAGACTVESNTVTAVLAEQVLTVPGKVFVSVSLQEEGQILATFAVQLNVKPKPGIAVMQSENYFCLKALIEAATVAARKPVQVITVSENADGGYVSSHYLSGIQSIINLQLPVACHWYEQDVTLCLAEYQNGGPFTFAAVSNAIEYRVVIKSDEDISCTMTELVRSDKIPVTSVNGQTGAVAVSTAIKVEVWQKNDGSYDYSHNSLRIMNALSAGNTVFCQLGTHYLLSLVYATPAKCIFTGVYEGELYAVTVTSTGATVTTTPLSSGGGGSDGITPHIGDNGNWFIGETDTGMPSRGEDAPQEAILYTPQDLTPEKQAQARQNIGAVPSPDSATVGQTIVVKEVNENGKPILWEAADLPSGGSGSLNDNPLELISDITLEEDVDIIIIEQDDNGEPFELENFMLETRVRSSVEGTSTGGVNGHVFIGGQMLQNCNHAGQQDAVFNDNTMYRIFNSGLAVFRVSSTGAGSMISPTVCKELLLAPTIKKITLKNAGANVRYLAGSSIKLYGRRVKK